MNKQKVIGWLMCTPLVVCALYPVICLLVVLWPLALLLVFILMASYGANMIDKAK